ncbi:tetratricopeptide repeat protein [Psychrobacter pygoscelis]|uniref:tetratricopeptide repeat protein n=1 Tax=Psychrobacter pygoscelis TaxID=2488563 RepID=UPI00103C9FED|nr:hypothetical protein [Psychrobacter pygoscelis]
MKRPIPAFSCALLATACLSVMTSAAQAAPQADSQLTVPSAIDSSRRIIRPAGAAAQSTNTAQPEQQQDVQRIAQQPAPSASVAAASADPETTVRRYQPPQVNPLADTGLDLSQGQLGNIPAPTTSVSDISFVETVLIPQTTDNRGNQLDVSLLDDFIKDVSPNARHYPPNFPNRSQRYNTREKIKVLSEWIEPYASAPNASYEVLLRAAKLNGMGRNLDLGSDYAVRASTYVANAITLQPNSGEANFLYGMMLTEGGGFKEGKKYLDRAVAQGYTEAEQSLAQSDLLSDNRSGALERLRQLKLRLPNDPILDQQIKLVEDGKFYIWDIPAPDINVKPVS